MTRIHPELSAEVVGEIAQEHRCIFDLMTAGRQA